MLVLDSPQSCASALGIDSSLPEARRIRLKSWSLPLATAPSRADKQVGRRLLSRQIFIGGGRFGFPLTDTWFLDVDVEYVADWRFAWGPSDRDFLALMHDAGPGIDS